MPSSTSKRRNLQRGAAYTETIIMLPFFFVIFGLLLFVARAYVGKSNLDSQARTCMWRHVMGGCGEPIAGCNIVDNPILVGEVPANAASTLSTVSNQLAGVSINVDEAFGDWFSEFFDVSDRGSFARPTIIGGGRQNFSVKVSNSCNETPSSASIYDFAAIAFCSHTGPCP